MKIFLALPTYDETIYVNTMFSAINAIDSQSTCEVCIEHASGSLLPRVFNRLLATAVVRGYDRLAMLHADIAIMPGWLSKMLALMDEHDADVLSAISPIKDSRALVSTCIYDRYDVLHTLSLAECHNYLPETFDVHADYLQSLKAEVLGVNTGVMVMRLDRPWLKQWSGFRILSGIRWLEKETVVEATSEDWQMSRELALLDPPPKVMATRAVQLHHRGAMVWPSHPPQMTQPRPGVAQENGPLALVQVLEFELGSKCNLAREHDKCPNLHFDRYADLDTSKELDDETIVKLAAAAYHDLGFTGIVGWIYYNEPLLQADRMFRLMGRIRDAVPHARFMLWTNGMLIPPDCDAYRQFCQIIVSGYNDQGRRGYDRLRAKGISALFRDHATLDDRLCDRPPDDSKTPCMRPFVEFIIDNFGNHHLCCYDWRGRASLGNVFTESLADIAARWRETIEYIGRREMTEQAPAACRACGHRWSRHQHHDALVLERVEQWRGQTDATCKAGEYTCPS